LWRPMLQSLHWRPFSEYNSFLQILSRAMPFGASSACYFPSLPVRRGESSSSYRMLPAFWTRVFSPAPIFALPRVPSTQATQSLEPFFLSTPSPFGESLKLLRFHCFPCFFFFLHSSRIWSSLADTSPNIVMEFHETPIPAAYLARGPPFFFCARSFFSRKFE